MVKRFKIDGTQPLTAQQLDMIREALDKPVQYDEDLPRQTKEQMAQFKRIADIKRKERRKQNVTLRLSPNALQKARSLGKGYTSILSRILEDALNNPEILKKHL